MKNLMTRRIVLGMLMTLALAFGVQGIVDAVTTNLLEGPTVDIDAKVVDDGITEIAFTPSLENADTTETISVSTSGIQLTEPTFTTSLTYSDATTDATQTNSRRVLDGSPITLNGYFTRVGVATLTISYRDIDGDGDGADTALGTQTHRYTYYVVRSDDAIPDGTTLRLTQDGRSVNSEGYITGLNGRRDFYIQSGSGDYPVTYDVSGGSAALRTGATFDDRTALTATDPIASRVRVWLDMNGDETFGQGATSTVRVRIGEDEADPVSDYNVVYIIGTPELDIGLTDGTATASVNATTDEYSFTGGTAGDNAGTIMATVTDGAGSPVVGALVKFDVVDKTVRGGYVSSTDDIVNERNAQPPAPESSFGRVLYVRTVAGGIATVTYQLGTASGEQEIRVTSVGKTQTVTAQLESSERPQKLFIKSNERQGSTDKYDLVAEVKDGDNPVSGMVVLFRTNRGTLTRVSAPPSAGAISTTKTVNVQTNALGEAQVIYDIGDNTGRQEIHASIYDTDDTNTADIDERIFRQEVTFVINGSAQPRQPTTPTPTTARLTITADVVTSEDPEREVTVNAISATGTSVPNYPVVLGSLDFTLNQNVFTGTPVTITLPDEPGTYTILAADASQIYQQGSLNLTVSSAPAPGNISIETIGDPVNGSQTIRVSVRDSDGDLVTSPVSVSLTGPGISRTLRTQNGVAAAVITLPTATLTLVAEATGYNSDSITLTSTGQTTTTTTTTRGTSGEADSIRIDGQRQLSGSLDQSMRLRVRILDANDNGVSDVRVTFRVLSPARGTFAGARGTGRAVLVETDRNGYANANFTPTTDGNVIVRASAGGVSPVTFIIAVDEAADTTTDTGTRDVGVSQVTVDIDDTVVHVGAAHRPPMLWVDGGKIYALVGANVQEFGSGIENALNIAVGGGKVYWTEKTGESAGTINSANLNGSNVQELASILAVPMGIAVDAANGKLYWTNSRGRIQTANLDGSGITNVMQNLPGPMDIAVARGNLYWTQYDATAGAGNVGILNPTAARTVARYISTGSDSPGSLAINGSKVYWTEMTGTNSGTINSANLTGTGSTELASILAAPSGIAVDGSRSKLYWTNSRGRIQSANLDGSKIQNVVSGLGSPGDMVLSNSITAPVATTTTTTTTTTSRSKYDVNGDGAVDNTDASLVAAAMNTSNARYDVNGDGTVNFLDLLLVFDNRDADAAGAPTIVGMKLSAVQIDVIKEQIDLLIATGDRSPVAIRTLIYLQQLIATARPEQTQLLANYPNPFNPETWIPYELATDTTVKITIYNTQGVVIRTLELGHQSAGYYTGRDRAAYWDGRNALGEQVASGIYFYQFETDDMSSMRKMVILK